MTLERGQAVSARVMKQPPPARRARSESPGAAGPYWSFAE
jgi:hypothetical protein